MAVPAPWRGRLSCRADGGLRLPAGAGRRRSARSALNLSALRRRPQYAARGIGAFARAAGAGASGSVLRQSRRAAGPHALRPSAGRTRSGQRRAAAPGQAPEDGAAIPGLGASLSGDGSGDAAPPPLRWAAAEAPPEPPPEYALDRRAPTSPRPGDGVLRRLAALARLVFLGRRTRRAALRRPELDLPRHQRPGRGGRQPEYQRPVLGSAAPVGGLQISNWTGSGAALPEGRFGYSSSVGRLNRMDPGASSGAVDYGASVGSGTVRYGLTPALTVEGQMQSAPTLTTRGMGTTYRLATTARSRPAPRKAPSTRSTPGATASATTSTCPRT